MPQRRFPRPWRFEPIPGGYRVIDANGLALAHVYGEPPNAIAISDKRLTNNEAEKIARLIARLPELVELEKDRNKARSRRKPQPLRFKPVTIGDLIREGKLLEVHCGNCRPERHLYIDRRQSRLAEAACRCRRWPNLCSVCGAKNSDTYHPIPESPFEPVAPRSLKSESRSGYKILNSPGDPDLVGRAFSPLLAAVWTAMPRTSLAIEFNFTVWSPDRI